MTSVREDDPHLLSVPDSPGRKADWSRMAERVSEAMPDEGLFSERTWRVSPEPFLLSRNEWKQLEHLGPLLLRFQKACDVIYRRSRKGTLPAWIAEYLDRGKPEELVELGLSTSWVEATPRVIRPDLILTDDGFIATELDSVPGGIGLTAWLGEVYQGIHPDREIAGGAHGMWEGFGALFGGAGADIIVSDESADYRPEMRWLAERLGGDWRVHRAEDYEPGDRNVYRFFELFDLPNLPGARAAGEAAARGEIDLTSPFKPWIEEKMWSALFHSHPLRDVWTRELRANNRKRLEGLFPRSWIVEPVETPHYAVIPGLEIQSFEELRDFTQSERELVLKLSGFSERAWGSRSVTIGQDSSQEEWTAAVDEALQSHDTSPFVLQRFHGGRRVEHPWWNPETEAIEIMSGRVRLCPYYFVEPTDEKVRLGGALATICPDDKKILHGMSDAILVPCAVDR